MSYQPACSRIVGTIASSLAVAVLAGSDVTVPDTRVELAVPPLSIKAKKKPSDEWTSYETRTMAQFAALPVNPPLDQYGGIAPAKADATGFFHTKKIGDR